MKIRLFVSIVESVLLYVSETWTLTNSLTKQIDGLYTRMLRMVQNVSRRDHLTNNLKRLDREDLKVIRHENENVNKLVLWQPNGGRVRRGRQKTNCIDVLLQDTGVTNVAELKTIMMDKKNWKNRVKNVVRPK